jgi:AbrB family looped-hinge helix DNA binding protein
MLEATLSRKNQIVIPLKVRNALGLKAGDKLLVVAEFVGFFLLIPSRSASP